ncbi:MAG: tRNA lysidine(34) synthetase TilS [Casimicrobiaceae bacterium]
MVAHHRSTASDAVDGAVDLSLAALAAAAGHQATAMPPASAASRGFASTGQRQDGAPVFPSPPPVRIVVGLSGGRDSMVLLHALACARHRRAIDLRARHVHHGLSVQADAWANFCVHQCEARDIPIEVVRVQVERRGGESLEAVARTARYGALAAATADAIALAHHADDQAETMLLQLLRGAGPQGLAGMGAVRRQAGAPDLVRPLLALPAAVLESYAIAHALAWIEDESNADIRLRRNALRHAVVPTLRAAFPGYPDTLVRAARHQAEAAALLDDLAAVDSAALLGDDAQLGRVLSRAGLAALAAARPDRARNVLRAFLRRHGAPAPSAARLAALLEQCTGARRDSRLRWRHAGLAIGVHGAWIAVHTEVSLASYEIAWHGETALALPGGTLYADRIEGGGIVAALVGRASIAVRPRRGGERLRIATDRPHRAVSRFLQDQRTPLWQRSHWPVLWDGITPIAVPGLGVDPGYAATGGTTGLVLRWEPG